MDVTLDKSVDSSVDASIDIEGETAPVIRLVHRIITEAVRTRASDIHVEPMADRIILRYRVDGVCHVRDNLPKRMQSAVLTRLKLMAGVNIAERRVPQDGRIKLPVDGETIDFRAVHPDVVHGRDRLAAALEDGEDYELLLAVPAEQELPDGLVEIGRVVETGPPVLIDAGGRRDWPAAGWEHEF